MVSAPVGHKINGTRNLVLGLVSKTNKNLILVWNKIQFLVTWTGIDSELPINLSH
jgi:hypothetical protein